MNGIQKAERGGKMADCPRYIYVLEHTITHKAYVGSSAKPVTRFKAHLTNLKSGQHSVEDMQADFNQYGNHFSMTIIDRCDTWDDQKREYMWMDILGTRERGRGYNYKDKSKPKKGKPAAKILTGLMRQANEIKSQVKL